MEHGRHQQAQGTHVIGDVLRRGGDGGVAIAPHVVYLPLVSAPDAMLSAEGIHLRGQVAEGVAAALQAHAARELQRLVQEAVGRRARGLQQFLAAGEEFPCRGIWGLRAAHCPPSRLK